MPPLISALLIFHLLLTAIFVESEVKDRLDGPGKRFSDY